MYSHLSIKVVPQVSLLQSSFLLSGCGQPGWEKPPGNLKPLLLKVCSDSQGAAPHQPELVLVMVRGLIWLKMVDFSQEG